MEGSGGLTGKRGKGEKFCGQEKLCGLHRGAQPKTHCGLLLNLDKMV